MPDPYRHISVLIIEPIQGQIKFVGRAQQLLVGISKDRVMRQSSVGSYAVLLCGYTVMLPRRNLAWSRGTPLN
jgi:hypothetical protein